MLDVDIKVTRTTQDARFDERGDMFDTIRVEFMVGKHGPFVERFPKDTYTADVRDQQLNRFAREVRTA